MEKFKGFLLINIGLFFTAVGIYFFKMPNNFAMGGVSGLAIILKNFTIGISVGPIMMIINIALLVVGFIFIGSSFGSKTVYSSFMLSGMVWLLERVYPMGHSLTDDMFLEMIFAVLLPGIGSAIVFNQGASTGGTDIIAKILTKYMHVNIGKTLLMADFLITCTAGIVFGIKIGLYSILGLLLKAFVIDMVIENLNISKNMVIVSSKPEEVREYIVKVLKRGATIHLAKGAFANEEKVVITTVVSRKQAIALRLFIKKIDEKAFISITNTSEIIGKGFRNVDI